MEGQRFCNTIEITSKQPCYGDKKYQIMNLLPGSPRRSGIRQYKMRPRVSPKRHAIYIWGIFSGIILNLCTSVITLPDALAKTPEPTQETSNSGSSRLLTKDFTAEPTAWPTTSTPLSGSIAPASTPIEGDVGRVVLLPLHSRLPMKLIRLDAVEVLLKVASLVE